MKTAEIFHLVGFGLAHTVRTGRAVCEFAASNRQSHTKKF
ncbi:hypothetical protein HMPREF0742_00409 [Rothia aeria F0184]|uniref:Uncharacterized protein n=1 Tax=Rothia aeria F0184 TaxID=888019 RepID=U7V8N1_9MICC|nr:hypothetical protein HMPREF0742_00409 [Rothia aeria F0184]